jgi:hypothetical protein
MRPGGRNQAAGGYPVCELFRHRGAASRRPAPRLTLGEDRTRTMVFALCANCDLRAEPTQCELSDQEQATPRTLPLAPGYGPRAASWPSGGEGGKDLGGFQ